MLSGVLEDVAEKVDDVWIETKPAGFALHTRLAIGARAVGRRHLMALAETQSEIEGLTVREGKNVLEFSIRSTTKGEALHHLKEYTEGDRRVLRRRRRHRRGRVRGAAQRRLRPEKRRGQDRSPSSVSSDESRGRRRCSRCSPQFRAEACTSVTSLSGSKLVTCPK